MTDKLPPHLLALFQPRPPLRYLPQADHAPEDRKTNAITGVAGYLDAMQEQAKLPYDATESWLQRRDRIRTERREKQKELHTTGFEKCTTSRA